MEQPFTSADTFRLSIAPDCRKASLLNTIATYQGLFGYGLYRVLITVCRVTPAHHAGAVVRFLASAGISEFAIFDVCAGEDVFNIRRHVCKNIHAVVCPERRAAIN
ncbi:hypothetical protein D3C73_923310 [compost metagenome]